MRESTKYGLLIILGAVLLYAENTQIPERSEIPEMYRWDLTHIYSSHDLWEADYNTVIREIGSIGECEGNLGKSAENLLECLKMRDNISRVVDKLDLFAYLQLDEDSRIQEHQAMTDRLATLKLKFGETAAFFGPELQKIPEKKINKFKKRLPELSEYSQFFDELFRFKDHTLSLEEEKLLAMTGLLSGTPWRVYNALTSTDIVYPDYINAQKDTLELSMGRYYQELESQDREVRKRVFKGMYETFAKFQNVNAAAFYARVKNSMFYTRARHYDNNLQAALYRDNVPIEVYTNLVQIIGDNLEPLHKYLRLRKEVMQLDEIHMYDTYHSIVKDLDLEVPYDQAVTTVVDALSVMGPEYVEITDKVLNSRWVDVYENAGKSSGAYSWGVYDSHPYILMNYTDTMGDMFTLAHEAGHATHSWYTNKTQPYIDSDYTLFVAEVASTFNEYLLLQHLLDTTEEKEMQIALLDQWINNLIGTVYVQTMFAEFEMNVHEMAESGVPLTASALNGAYMAVLEKYYGAVLTLDDAYKLNWGRIPHFYDGFYVYKYATSFCTSTILAQRILDEEPGSQEAYLTFLKSGSSDYSINLLQKAGVDLTRTEPILDTVKLFERLVDDLEKMIKG